MTITAFINELKNLNFENTFNPYSECCDVYDRTDAAKIRSQNLKRILKSAYVQEIDSFWVGRDLGYRGGRRTGLPFTDDVYFNSYTDRWRVSAQRPTKGEMVTERTATVIGDLLVNLEASTFLWNIFPLHPHEPGNNFSNRAHNRQEREIGIEILHILISLLHPKKLVAIGRDAAKSVEHFCDEVNVIHVRHPSYGGKRQFLAQMNKIYRIKD